MDSFGMPPPNEVLKATGDTKQIQDYYSSACGWFVIACIVFDSKEPIEVHFNRFISMFSSFTKANGLILRNLLKSKGII